MASMQTPASPIPLDDLIDVIVDFVAKRYAKTGRSSHGPTLVEAVCNKFPNFRFKDAKVRLADLVKKAEERGLVFRHKDVSHLEVSPGLATSPSTTERHAPAQKIRHVRRVLWKAFTLGSTGQNLVFDRQSGEITSRDADENKDQPDNEQRFVNITPIPTNTQKQWLTEFLEANDVAKASEAPTSGDKWWTDFSRWLATNDSQKMSRLWKRFHATRAVEMISLWSDKHGIPDSAVYTPERRKTTEKRITADRSSNRRLRTAILAAISEMPTEQLVDLTIPIRCMLKHFDPK